MNAVARTSPGVAEAGAPGPGPDHGAPGLPAPGEVHTCLIPVRPRPEWHALLDAEETERLSRLAAGEARDTFATSRAVQRLLGARYLGLPPAEVRVIRDCEHCAGNHGRPRFAGGPVEYSVSHTGEWLLVAVTAGGPVGVDVESTALRSDVDKMASIVLTGAERERFARLPARTRARWLVRSWTRKEAAMKLVGLGLAAPPGKLDVTGPVVAVDGVPRWPDVPVFLQDLPAPPGHAAALATTVEPTAVRALPPPSP